MKLEGTAEFPFQPAMVWAALHDVDVLVKTIPGCQSMVPEGDGSYRVKLALGVAAIKGEYEGIVAVTDIEFPRAYRLHGEGSGSPGYVKLEVDCRLEEVDGGTSMQWTCDCEVGGLIAGIGGRVLSGISKFMAKQFFKALDDEMKSSFESRQMHSAEGSV